MNAPIVEYVDGHALLGRHRNLFLGVWWARATLAHVDAVRTCCGTVLGEHRTFASAILVLEGEGIFSFAEGVRGGMAEVVAETEDSGVGTAFIIHRGGFVGGAIRAFLSGVFLVARTKEPQRAFADLDPAATWLASCLAAPPAEVDWTKTEVLQTLTTAKALAEEARDKR
jgi:hypothetical protein